jgi:tRNA U55 pseudouridine synthase TruB
MLPAFVGDILQVPQFSAVKIDGERAYNAPATANSMDIAARPSVCRRT